ncbi:MAG: GNAT family N-acetyltransferase [Bacteroidetes bacterium]|nr:MAG: GNAT family N-acetyltransferase [Bacteroidota bacterium]
MNIEVTVAGEQHHEYAQAICDLIEEAAKARGTGIAKRQPAYILQKMKEGKAVIALAEGRLAGFCYIESWDDKKYVANSGLIVSPDFRNMGLAKRIKQKAFELSRQKYPDAKLFGITTSLAVMKINSQLGYKPVTFSELTQDEVFWSGCQSCPNFDVLSRNNRKLCLCTGMLYDPAKEEKQAVEEKPKSRWQLFKAHLARRQKNPILQRIKENFSRPKNRLLMKQ